MTECSDDKQVGNSQDQDLTFFGPPPLVSGEDPHSYDQLLAYVTSAVKPTDIFEQIWVRDFVCLEWEIIRFRRAKAEIINTAQREVEKTVRDPMHIFAWVHPDGDAMAAGPDAGLESVCINDLEDRDKAGKSSAADGNHAQAQYLSRAKLVAQAIAFKMDDLDRLDRMVTTLEVRRDKAYWQIGQHRSSLAAGLRRAVEQIEDAEFSEVDSTSANRRLAA